MMLTDGVLAFLLEYPDQLVKLHVDLDSNNLNEVLEKKENRVLSFLLEHADQLIKKLVELDSGDLKEVLERKNNGILKFLFEHPDQLVKMLNEHLNQYRRHYRSLNLKTWLLDVENGILKFLFEYLDQLVKMLVELESGNLYTIFPELDLNDLKKVLELEVDGKKMHNYINDMLNDAEVPNLIKSKLTEILQKSEIN
jgi:hypothetical protein